jgi:hypothetical protein
VAPTLDKTGVFCRQALDCLAVVRALIPLASPKTPAAAAASGGLLGAPIAQASSALQDKLQRAPQPEEPQPSKGVPAAVPYASQDTFRSSLGVNLSATAVGFLPGTSPELLGALRRVPGLRVVGPLPLPPGTYVGTPRLLGMPASG